jgi:formylglycine-generating enzyme required for sulfatase activity
MATNTSLCSEYFLVLALAMICSAPPANAQAPASLSIQIDDDSKVALTITGTALTTYSIEYTPDLRRSDEWRVAEVLELPSSPYIWVDKNTPGTGNRYYRLSAIQAEPETNMIWIPPGTFLMGSPAPEALRSTNEIQHEVTLTEGYWMGKHEVTQGEYILLMGNNPSYFRNGTNAFGSGGVVTNELFHPVEKVSWFDATNYCGKLTVQERNAGRLPASWEYRLPTEAEWEYACRSGTTTSHHYGNELRSGMANFRGTFEYEASLGTIQNPDGIYLGRTSEVGSYEPNPRGLYDMHGNVWEWCQDWRGDYPAEPVTNPTGSPVGLSRVTRGGDWGITGWYCRSARRFGGDPTAGRSNVGFRVVRAPVRTDQ